MVTLPFPGNHKAHHHRPRRHHPKAGTATGDLSSSSSPANEPSSSSTTLSGSRNRMELFKVTGLGGSRRGAIRLQDSIEEEEGEEVCLQEDGNDTTVKKGLAAWGDATEWPSSSSSSTPSFGTGITEKNRHLLHTTDAVAIFEPNVTSAGAAAAATSSSKVKKSTPVSGKGLRKLASSSAAAVTRANQKAGAGFQRLDATGSTGSSSDAGSSSSSAFDVNHVLNSSHNKGAFNSTATMTTSTTTTTTAAEDSLLASTTEVATTSKKAKKTTLGSKIKLKIKGTKTFQRLDNVEGSHDHCAYVPPSDYASMVGTRDDPLVPPTTALRLLQIASQSHYAQPSPPAHDMPFDERRTEESSSSNTNRNSKSAPPEEDEPREDVEFRQFVFDKNFSTIEAVNVAKSDSGTGNDDIFRMAAVETVTRMSLSKFGSSPSPSRRPSDAIKLPYSPASGLLPKSPHLQHRPVSAVATTTNAKSSSPGGAKVSRGNSTHKSNASEEATSSSSSMDDAAKKRFQDLVKRTGKLSVQSPVSSTANSLVHSSPGRHRLGSFASSSRFGSSSPLQQPRTTPASNGGGTKESAQPVGTKEVFSNATTTSVSQHALGHGFDTSPLGTHRHFGNSGGKRSVAVTKSSPAVASVPVSKTRNARVDTTISSVVSTTASIANATVSTGPDENRRLAKVGWPTERQDPFRHAPTTNQFEADDNDDPFRIGQEDPWKDTAAWNVDRVAFPAPNQRKAATKPTTTGSTSSASRGDNSLLIQSIRSAMHSNKSRASRHREAQVHRPDPSPRGVPHSSSDSVLDFKPAKEGGRSAKVQLAEHDDVVTSKSDGAMDADHRTLGSAAMVEASPVTIARIGHGRKTPSKAPSGVPEHAILASMLFRQTEVFQQNDEAETNGSQARGPPSKQKQAHHKAGPSTEAVPGPHRFDVPAAVHTSSAASVVSSVTEEASVFYSKNLQPSSYKSQAQMALNNYHNLRAKQMQQKPHAPTGRIQQPQRAPHSQQHQQQPQPPRTWGNSSSASRKTTASSTGRPTWLDRVEEEHMRMFS